jgi:SAM-dependent methyltransferase
MSLPTEQHGMLPTPEWQAAQTAEKEYWLTPEVRAKIEARVRSGHYKSQAIHLLSLLAPYYTIQETDRILQIGSAVIGAINWIPDGQRFAVDPLADFYNEHFAELVNPEVCLTNEIGESTHFPDEFFDLVITTQTLTHVISPDRLLQEVSRLLRQNNLFLLTVTTINASLSPEQYTEAVMEFTSQKKELRFFTYESLEELLRRYFSILHVEHRHKSLTSKTTVICRKS